MSIVFRCPCGKKLKVKDSKAGKKVTCPFCQTAIGIPRIPPNDGATGSDVPPAIVFNDSNADASPQPPVSSPAVDAIPAAAAIPAPPVAPIALEPSATEHPLAPIAQPIPVEQEFAPVVVATPSQTFNPDVSGFDPVGPPPVQPQSSYAPVKPGRKQTSIAAILIGVLAMAFGVCHMLCGGFIGIGAMMLGGLSRMAQMPTDQMPNGMPNPAQEAMATAQLWTFLLMAAVFVFSITLIVGSIGLFRGAFWGWVTTVITAVISVLISIGITFSYFQTESALQQSRETQQKMIENMDERSRAMMQDQIEFQEASTVRLTWTFWSGIGIYAGYGLITGITLMRPSLIRSIRE